MKKQLIYFIIITFSIFLFACQSKTENISRISSYIVNTRSKKVHSLDCGSGKLMSDENREERTDSILNICSDGYKICKNCNAGFTRKYFSLAYELPSKKEYLEAIDSMGEWYVNNIPTYWREIQEIYLNEYDNQERCIVIYNLIDKRNGLIGKKKNFNVISNSLNENSIKNYDSTKTLITCANENAIISYKNNFNKIKFKKKLAYYECEYIKNCKEYNKAGDDCVRFIFSVFNCLDNQFVNDIVEISNKSWSKINSTIFKTDTNLFLQAMQMKGFDVYDSNVEKYFDGKVSVNKIRDINSSFSLEKGDIIVRDGHVHIYLGDNMINANNFGWGKVNSEYPMNYNFYLKCINNNYYIICDSDRNENGEYNLYTRVYRYVGGNDES